MPRAFHQQLLTGLGLAFALSLPGVALARAPEAAVTVAAMHRSDPADEVSQVLHSLAPRASASAAAEAPELVESRPSPAGEHRPGTFGMVMAALVLMGVIALRRQRLDRS